MCHSEIGFKIPDSSKANFIKESTMIYLFLGIKIFESTGTTMKDTWTKPRGRVEVGEGGGFSWGGVEGWGEKAYNCN